MTKDMTPGFGLEKIGLTSMRHYRLALVLGFVITTALLICSFRLGFSSDIREIFRTNSLKYSVFEQMTGDFPGNERDLFLTIESKSLFEVTKLEKLKTLHLELVLVEGVEHVLSMFSARNPPDSSGKAKLVIPDQLGDEKSISLLEETVRNHPLIAGKLLSEDGQLTLFLLTLDNQGRDLEELKVLIAEIQSVVGEMLENTDIKTSMTGLPIMRSEIIGALMRDQLIFKIVGITLGMILSLLFFKKIRYVLIIGVPVLAALIWLLGAMALVGQEINVLTNVAPTLVLVIAFSDSVHLLFGIQRNLRDGKSLERAIEIAVLEVGPACVLTSITTALALVSLTLVPHPFISQFGITAAFGTAIAYLATLGLLPALSLVLMRGQADSDRYSSLSNLKNPVHRISKIFSEIIKTHPVLISVAGILMTLICGGLYSLNEPRYMYQANLPRDNEAFVSIQKINQKLAGTSTIRIFIRLPSNQNILSEASLDLISDAHNLLRDTPLIKQVWSLQSIIEWLESGGRGHEDFFLLFEKARTPLKRRLISIDNRSALVTGHFAEVDASELVPVITALESQLEHLRTKHPKAKIHVTGISPLSASMSHQMISELNRSLLIAIILIIILIGLALRSLSFGIASILPNLLPIAAAGAYLFLSDEGLQFSAIIAFTIGFGIAVDDTIHVLNRYNIEKLKINGATNAVTETIRSIGPILIVSTAVFAVGLGSTILSDLPTVQLYGHIAIIVIISALIGDLLFLPALVRILEMWREPERPSQKLPSYSD